jgi:putative transposase
MLTTFVQVPMRAEADVVGGAGFSERSSERTNTQNGDRHRHLERDTAPARSRWPSRSCARVLISLVRLLERRGRAEATLMSEVASSYCSGYRGGGWRSWSRAWTAPGYRSGRCR